jgi:hypothetical protein
MGSIAVNTILSSVIVKSNSLIIPDHPATTKVGIVITRYKTKQMIEVEQRVPWWWRWTCLI